MSDGFKIWIDRLKEGKTQTIDALIPPDFLDIHEKELEFHHPVQLLGSAYLADIHLILHLNASTKALMPCVVCNQMIEKEIKIVDFYHTQPISEISNGIFDFREILREALLSELPKYVECGDGNCSQREALAPFLKKKNKAKPDVHFPFADLEP